MNLDLDGLKKLVEAMDNIPRSTSMIIPVKIRNEMFKLTYRQYAAKRKWMRGTK